MNLFPGTSSLLITYRFGQGQKLNKFALSFFSSLKLLLVAQILCHVGKRLVTLYFWLKYRGPSQIHTLEIGSDRNDASTHHGSVVWFTITQSSILCQYFNF